MVILVPSQPALAKLTLRLRFDATVLLAYTRFDSDTDLNWQTAQEPYNIDEGPFPNSYCGSVLGGLA